MNTNDLINNLSKNVSPTKGADSLAKFSIKGFLVLTVIAALSYYLLPMRNDFAVQIQETGFALESILWILTGVFSGFAAYQKCIPGLSSRNFTILATLSLIGVLSTIPWGSTYITGTLREELQLYKGICGGLITIMSGLGAAFFFAWAKKNAPTNYKSTGFWIVLSTSSFGSAAMQLVCAHDSAFHIYLWHAIPTAILAYFGAWMASRLLRW